LCELTKKKKKSGAIASCFFFLSEKTKETMYTPDLFYANKLPFSDYRSFVGKCQDVAPPGTIRLYKEDFHVLPSGQLTLKRLAGKEAFVLFVVGDCRTCQDTKQTWQAFACDPILTERLLQYFRGVPVGGIRSTAGMQYLMFKQPNGLLVDL
jgi:hypothetical protein